MKKTAKAKPGPSKAESVTKITLDSVLQMVLGDEKVTPDARVIARALCFVAVGQYAVARATSFLAEMLSVSRTEVPPKKKSGKGSPA